MIPNDMYPWLIGGSLLGLGIFLILAFAPPMLIGLIVAIGFGCAISAFLYAIVRDSW